MFRDPRAWLQAFLEEQSTLVLSTAADAGPSGAPLFYLPGPGCTLHWISAATCRHSVELARLPHVAISIHASTFRWEEIRGAQLRGEAAAVEDSDARSRILAGYRERFALPPSFDAAIARSAVYRFVPAWARCLDNAAGFPGKVEIDFGSPACP